jgi:hypothetical protein
MSLNLVTFVKSFLDSTSDCSTFCDQYARQWKNERDSGALSKDDAATSEALASIFCLVDLFNPADDREEYEFNEEGFRVEIAKVSAGLRATGS